MRRTIRAIQTTYGGVKFRSRVEARWAVFFDAMGIRYEYEPEGFEVRGGAYLPDFRLAKLHLFLEIKGQAPSEEEVAKCADLARAAEYDVLLAVGPPDERFQIIWFDREGRREGEYVLAQDRFAECGYWLVGDVGESNWIGPAPTPTVPRGPMLSGVIEQAIALARSERFEGATKSRRIEPLEHPADRLWRIAA